MDTGKETCQGECIKRETILEKRYQVGDKFYSYKEQSVFLIENFQIRVVTDILKLFQLLLGIDAKINNATHRLLVINNPIIIRCLIR